MSRANEGGGDIKWPPYDECDYSMATEVATAPRLPNVNKELVHAHTLTPEFNVALAAFMEPYATLASLHALTLFLGTAR